jgi:hypothetical protein
MFYNNDALNEIKVKRVLGASIASNTTTQGAVYDLVDNSSVVIKAQIVVSARTDGTYTPLLEWSDDNVTYVAIPDESLKLRDVNGNYIDTAQEATAALSANGEVEIGIVKNKRYIRPSIVSTSVTSGARVDVIIAHTPRLVK